MMNALWGSLILVLSLPCWGGQVLAFLRPGLAERWKLAEPESSVDPVFHADGRAEALWDSLTLWTMPVAGSLLIVGHDSWAYFGLFAGAIYLYFAGRGILSRRAIARSGGRIGGPDAVKTAYLALAVWGLMGIVVALCAIVALT